MDDADVMILVAAALTARVGVVLLLAGAGRARFAGAAAWRGVLDLALVVVLLAVARRVGLVGGVTAGGVAGLASLAVPFAGALLAGGFVASAVAERGRTRAMILGSAVYAGVVLPACLRATEMLTDRGYIDDGGASLFHLTAGMVALAACAAVGPRNGRFERDGSVSVIPGHQLPLSLGGLALWTLGAVVGTAAIAGSIGAGSVRLLLAVAAGVLVAAAYSRWRFERVDPTMVIPAVIGAVAAAAPLAGRAEDWQALLAGGLGALASLQLYLWVERKLRLDELVGAASAQIAGAAVGVLLAGAITATTGGATPRGVVLVFLTQLLGLAVFAAAALIPAMLIFLAARRSTTLRLTEQAEYEGTDLATHDINAYPDFSQPTIRSSHLREV